MLNNTLNHVPTKLNNFILSKVKFFNRKSKLRKILSIKKHKIPKINKKKPSIKKSNHKKISILINFLKELSK